MQCNKPGGMQLRLLPFAIGSFLAYTVGFPLILALVLIKYRKRIYEDQVRVSFVVLVFSFLETCIPIHKSRKGRLPGVAYGVCDQTGEEVGGVGHATVTRGTNPLCTRRRVRRHGLGGWWWKVIQCHVRL